MSVSYRGVALAIGLSLGSAGLAAGCAWRAQRISTQADRLLARGAAEAAEYTSTFDGRHIDQELVTFQERRVVLERAHVWQRGAIALVMLSALLLLASYALFLLVRLEEQQLASPGGSLPSPASHTAVQVR